MKAILLAGGFGTRLRPLTLNTPKPIVPILDRPFLYYQIDLLKQIHNIDEVILSLNYRPEQIEAVVGDGRSLGIKIKYLVEPKPLGTGGAVKYAEQYLDDSVIVFNGDILAQINLANVVKLHRERKAKATIVLTPVQNPSAYGLVETDSDSNVLNFSEKPSPDSITCNTINAGIYILEPDTFHLIPKDTKWSIERGYFPALIKHQKTFVAHIEKGYWIDIGTPDKYLQIHQDILDGRYQTSAFLKQSATHRQISSDARIEDETEIEAPAFIGSKCLVKKGAHLHSHVVLGSGCTVKEGARVENSIIWEDTEIGSESYVNGAILGRNCRIGDHAVIGPGTVIGDGSIVTDYSIIKTN